MNPPPNLREVQRWLQWVVTDPRGARAALDEPHPNIEMYQDRYTEPTLSQLRWIEGGRVASESRLSVYAEAYFFRMLECFEKDFPKTRRVMGQEIFANAVAEYLKGNPSKFYSVDEVGWRFPQFLAETDLALEPWAKDLALFEWLQIEAFYSPDPHVHNANWKDHLATMDANRIHFLIHPSVRLMHSQWSITQVVNQHETEAVVGQNEIQRGEQFLVIYRYKDESFWDELDSASFKIIEELKSGNSLEAAMSGVNLDSNNVSNFFSRWIERGIICGLKEEK